MKTNKIKVLCFSVAEEYFFLKVFVFIVSAHGFLFFFLFNETSEFQL